jgi:hypothetical protein
MSMNKILGTALNPIGGDAEKVKAAPAAAAASTVKTYKHGGKVSAPPGESRKFV